MKLIFFLLLVIINCSSCVVNRYNVIGTYASKCVLHDETELNIVIRSDSTFLYNFRYLDELITGKWELKGNKIFLFSKYFSSQFQNDENPKRKNSDIPGKDIYKIKKNRLYVITKKDLQKNVF